jgi:hypothetical protein
MMLTNAWSTFLIDMHPFGRPADHLLSSGAIFLGIYSLVVGAPYFFLWRSYSKARLDFVSVQDEVAISGKKNGRQTWIALAGLTVLLLAGLMFFYLVRAK